MGGTDRLKGHQANDVLDVGGHASIDTLVALQDVADTQ